jgi:phosphoserine phosphatase RsbU/P
MRVLIADDDPLWRRLLEAAITQGGYEAVVVNDGSAAWEVLGGPTPPPLAILDWEMPGLDGVELCRRVRARLDGGPSYVILLTARDRMEDLVTGLAAGADDYVAKPYQPDELRARLQVGIRVLGLQQALAERITGLEAALAHVKQLQGLLAMCAWCRRIRDDRNFWQNLETYVAEHSDAQFTHGVCPDCRAKLVPGAKAREGST